MELLTLNDTLLNRFTQAFNGSAVDSAAMNRVYQRWIELRRESLEDLPASLRDEVLSDLVADRARANMTIRATVHAPPLISAAASRTALIILS